MKTPTARERSVLAPGDTAKTWPSSNIAWQVAKDDGWISSASRRVPRPAFDGRRGENDSEDRRVEQTGNLENKMIRNDPNASIPIEINFGK